MYFMATDGYGNYSRSWTYDELYGVKRYYFEGLYDSWSTGWEVGGEQSSKQGITLAEYNRRYKVNDPYERRFTPERLRETGNEEFPYELPREKRLCLLALDAAEIPELEDVPRARSGRLF